MVGISSEEVTLGKHIVFCKFEYVFGGHGVHDEDPGVDEIKFF